MNLDNSQNLKVVVGVERLTFTVHGEEMLCHHKRLKKCMNEEQNEVYK